MVELLDYLNGHNNGKISLKNGIPSLHVAAVPASLLSDPGANGLLWKLVYTGRTTYPGGAGDPLYWIVAFDDRVLAANRGQVVLAVAPIEASYLDLGPRSGNPGEAIDAHSPFVGLIDKKELSNQHPETSNAAWTLTPVGASGRDGTRYLIRSHTTGRLLGPLTRSEKGDPYDHAGVAMYAGRSKSGPVPKTEIASYAWQCIACDPPAVDPNQPSDSLQPGQSLSPGEAITSQNDRFTLIYQTDGNLALYDKDAAGRLHNVYWQSIPLKTGPKDQMKTIMQLDGNLVIYVGKTPVWATNSYGDKSKGSFLQIRDSGEVVIWGPDYSRVWPKP